MLPGFAACPRVPCLCMLSLLSSFDAAWNHAPLTMLCQLLVGTVGLACNVQSRHEALLCHYTKLHALLEGVLHQPGRLGSRAGVPRQQQQLPLLAVLQRRECPAALLLVL